MKINKVLAELEALVIEPEGDEISEHQARRLHYQVGEYKRQEAHFAEIIQKERLDLSDYISMKMAKIEALTDMSKGAEMRRAELEDTLEKLNIEVEEGR